MHRAVEFPAFQKVIEELETQDNLVTLEAGRSTKIIGVLNLDIGK